MPIVDGSGNELFPISKEDRLLAAAYLLESYDRRLGTVQKTQAIVASGEKAYDASMTQLAGLILKLHPALMPNLRSEHLPIPQVRVVWHDANSPPGGKIIHRLVALDEFVTDKRDLQNALRDLSDGTGTWVEKDGKKYNVFVPSKYAGFDADDLRDAFKKIAPKGNWKDAIRARVLESDLEMLDAAAAFITGGGLEVTKRHRDGTVEVSGAGYYSNVGA